MSRLAEGFARTVAATAEAHRSRVDDGTIGYRLSTPDTDVRGAALEALACLPDALRSIVLGN